MKKYDYNKKTIKKINTKQKKIKKNKSKIEDNYLKNTIKYN